MDRITKSMLEDFVADNSLEAVEESKAFEHFCNSLVTSSHHSESFTLDDIATGSSGDSGIDGIAVLVNGNLVTEPEEVDDLEKMNGYIDATFVFVQAERSSSFKTDKIGQFGFGVRDFLSEKPSLVQNDSIKQAASVVEAVFDRSAKFTRGNPQCFMYYATTGTWVDDTNLIGRRDAEIRDVKATSLFREVSFECLGATELQKLYRESKSAVTTEITFVSRTEIPEMPDVEQAYIGILPAPEFLKLVQNSNEEILGSIFYDNVRHFQDWNPVNKEMRETLMDAKKRVYFPLLNNGVTVVAKRVRITGSRFIIEDYQVVNGCQTSFVLHECRNEISDKVFVPLRLISTEDPEIRDSIIRTTNRQTSVGADQLAALLEFPKKLELYFPTYEGKRKLYYERRSKQYSGMDGIEKVRVINLRALVRSFASIFMRIPHRTTRNYRTLVQTFTEKIFNSEHKLEPYYIAAYAHYRLECLFRSQVISAELKAARYHLLMAFCLIYSTDPLPRLNSKDIVRWCSDLCELLWDETKSKEMFELAALHVRIVADGDLHRDNIRTEPFTEALKARFFAQ